jgi:hypothetical protein
MMENPMRHIWLLIVLLITTLACAVTKESDTTPPPPPGGVQEFGFVEVQGFSAINQGGNYVFPIGESATFIWQDADLSELVQVEFSYRAYADGNLVSVGIDNDLSDGAQVTWTVPTAIAGTITASGRLPGQSGDGMMSAGVGINSEDQAGAIRNP